MYNFNAKEETVKVTNWINNWFETESGNAKGIVLGISGGKDSTVTSKLCVDAIGKDKVLGVLMPNGEQPDIKDSIEICEFLGIPYKTVNISSIYNAVDDSIRYNKNGEVFSLSSHTKTNISPRIRMTILYAIGQELGYRVCGTGNLSEKYVGYFTKWGDGAFDFNPIGNFTTDEVIAIGDYLNLPYHLVHKAPSDGLCGKTDEENLGFTYEILNKYINTGDCEDPAIKEKIDKMYQYNLHKSASVPVYLTNSKKIVM